MPVRETVKYATWRSFWIWFGSGDDLLDRCGKHPVEFENLFKITEISIKAKYLEITKIVQSSKYLKFKFSETLKDKTLSKAVYQNFI